MDLKIAKNNKLVFGIVVRDIYAHNYIKADSYNPVSHKHPIINSLTNNLVKVLFSTVQYKKGMQLQKKMVSKIFGTQKKITVQERLKIIKNSTT